MFCSNCGNKLEDDANFCPKCGKKVAGNATSESSNTNGTFTDPRDGREYKTVKIGEQVWMAENLAYDAEGSKCYNGNPANCRKYGKLYGWETAMKSCPPGWYLPSDDEWQTLVDFVGGAKIAGKKLKAKNGWDENGNGTDDFGFSALPGGCADPDGNFGTIGSLGIWWSSTCEDNNNDVHFLGIKYNSGNVSGDKLTENYLFSVRCIQGNGVYATTESSDTGETFTDQRDGKVYKTVKIGNQVWMAENLAYDAKCKGCKIYGEGGKEIALLGEDTLLEAEIQANCDKYGRLYDWETAMKSCPAGWHLPSNEELEELVQFAGGIFNAGEKLKAKSGWTILDKGGTDDFGFAGLPGGWGNSDYDFLDVEEVGQWWCATENSDEAYYYSMDSSNNNVSNGCFHKSFLYSVRCIKD